MLRVEEDRRARAERQRALGVVENIHSPLSRLAAESVREVLLTPRMLLAAAYLVDRERVDAFRAEAHAFGPSLPGVAVSINRALASVSLRDRLCPR